MKGLVVVGASLAGLRAVEAARRYGFAGPITLVGAERHLPYDRPPLSKACLDLDGPPDTTFRTEQLLRSELGVELALGEAATGLDTVGRKVLVGGREIGYDALVIATGATARTLPGTDGLPGVHTLRTLDDATAVRAALDRGARTVVVGSGFIGSEVASAARKRGLPVTVIEAAVPLQRSLGDDMGRLVADLHHRAGTDLRCGSGVQEIVHDGHELRVRLTNGDEVACDTVVVGIGSAPATSWLAGSGVPIGDGVLCDERLWTGVPGVYAAGDVACWHNPLFGEHMRLEHWTSAAEQGATAARNALAGEPAAYSTVPYFWSDWYDIRIQFVGVPRAGEIRIVSGDPAEGRFVALYRDGDRLVGALALNHPTHIMKYRVMIGRGASWSEALEFARARNDQAAAAP
ncbi:NAD(P)/FAD-dependent oxidoreductase [Nonomuraea sp. NPDC050556]|uniref:NAD(P)/FAD-dependent oxidoreductase n=1 Tax=Nonomuraea sp. NPDC050556 TaxID=3364369 RepID=UPI00379F1CB8